MRNPDNLWRLLILDLDERDNIAENSKTEPPSQVAYIIHCLVSMCSSMFLLLYDKITNVQLQNLILI